MTDKEVFDDMVEILRLKRIAEEAEDFFASQQNAITPVPIAMQNSATVTLSSRDVGEMYGIIKRLSLAKVGSEWVDLVAEANKFIGLHGPVDKWEQQ